MKAEINPAQRTFSELEPPQKKELIIIGDTVGFPNGVTTIVEQLGQKLSPQGITVSPFSPILQNDLLASVPVPFYPGLQFLTDLKIFQKLERHLEGKSASDAIIITSFAGPLALATISYCDRHNINYNLLFSTNVPEIARNRLGIPREWGEAVTKYILKNAAKIFVHSRQDATKLEQLGIPNIEHWPPGIDENTFRRPYPNETNPYTSDFAWYRANPLPVLISTCRHSPDKDLQEFPWDYPNTHKVILSDGPQKPKLEAMVAENNWKNVHFLGRVPRDKLTDYVRWADIMPFPSRYETWSLSALEAVASGVPLVARRSGGPSEFVTPGVNGIFVPDGQPLSDGIAAAMAVDRDRCSQTIHAKYGLGNAAQQLLKLAVPMRN